MYEFADKFMNDMPTFLLTVAMVFVLIYLAVGFYFFAWKE